MSVLFDRTASPSTASARRFSRRVVPAMLGVALSFGCASILDIDEASFDPNVGSAPGAGGTPPTGGSGATGGSGSGATGGGEDPCDLYCTTVLDNCTGDNQVYLNETVCRSACEVQLAQVESDAEAILCRTEQATRASTTGEPDSHCAAAGPGGDGVCGGDNCESYCAIMLSTCLGAYAGVDDCLADCDTAVDLDGYNVSQTTGDTVQCRLYHVTAATLDPGLHCGHSSGLSPCSCSATIENNHRPFGHILELSDLDLNGGVGGTFEFSETESDHVHSITLTPAEVIDLAFGEVLEVESSTATSDDLEAGTHQHRVTINCGI